MIRVTTYFGVVYLPSEEEFMKILERSGLSKKEIEEKVKQTIDRMKGLINEETALYILIKELGLDSNDHIQQSSSEKDTLIQEIKDLSNNICVVGRIIDKSDLREFTKKTDGKKGLFSKFIIKDTTGDIGVILWDDRAKYVQQEDFKLNELVRVINGQVKKNKDGKFEIHVGNKGSLEFNPNDVDYKLYPKEMMDQLKENRIENNTIKISEINSPKQNITIEAEVILKEEVKIIDKKEKTLTLQKIMVKDNTASITITFWNDDINKLKDIQEGDLIIAENVYAKPQFNDSSRYELNFGRDASIKIKKKADPSIQQNVVVPIETVVKSEGVYSIQGEITEVDNLKEIEFKDKTKGKLLSFILVDETAAIRVSLWREQAEKNIDLKIGDKIRLNKVVIKRNSFSGRNEVSLNSGSTIEKNIKINLKKKADSSNLNQKDGREQNSQYNNIISIKDINSEGFFTIKGFIAKEINRITFYEACSTCHKKAENCSCSEGPKNLEYRQIFNIIIDDGSDTIRGSLIGDMADKLLGLKAIDVKMEIDSDHGEDFLKDISIPLMGKELIFRGRSKFSTYNNQYELTINDFKEVDSDNELTKLIKEIET